MTQLHCSHLCTLGERSEGATTQLTARGACPKPSRARAAPLHRGAACSGPGGGWGGALQSSSIRETAFTARHLRGSMLSAPHYVCACTYVFELHVHVFVHRSVYLF